MAFELYLYIQVPWLIPLVVGGLVVLGATLAAIFGRKK